MRSRRECLRDWPEPRQPGELHGTASEQLFAESTIELDHDAAQGRLKIQL